MSSRCFRFGETSIPEDGSHQWVRLCFGQVILAVVLVMMLVVGCGEPTDGRTDPVEQTQSPETGTSGVEGKVSIDPSSLHEAIAGMFGPLRNAGEARFLLGFMTQDLVDDILVDSVNLYNIGVEPLHAWVVYDGVRSGKISAKLRTGSGDEDVVAKTDVALTDEYGWAGISFERPDNGWSVSHCEAMIIADDAEMAIEFTMNYHDTASGSLVESDGQIRLPGAVCLRTSTSGAGI